MYPAVHISRAASCIAAACLLQTAFAASDWPEFRGPTGQGLSQASNTPTHWNARNNVVWKTAIPGDGWSSPALSNGKIYLTTAVHTEDSDQTSLRTVCIAANDGTIRWDVEVFQPEPDAVLAIHRKNTLASPTPVVRDERIYVHFGHMGTAALDPDGKILWRQTGLKYAPLHGNGGSPILVDDLLILNCDGTSDPFVAALSASNGEIKWRTPRNTDAQHPCSFSTPLAIVVDGRTQVVSPGSGFVGGYDPTDGREIWRVDYNEGFSVVPRPVFEHGLLFVASGFQGPGIHAIDPSEAQGNVTESHVAWIHPKRAPCTPSPLVVGEELYLVSGSGVATCMDARTGEIHWSERLGERFGGGVYASPIHAEGKIYFQNEKGVGFVVKAGKEYKLLAVNDLEERTLASPAVIDGALFLRSESHLWRIGE